jgi:hypothetical protein
MNSKYFTYGFFGIFIAAFIIILVVYKFTLTDFGSNALSIFLGIFIILFLLFGVIAISLFLSKKQENSSKKGL